MSWAEAANDPKPEDVEEGKKEEEGDTERMSAAQEKGLMEHPLETDRNCLKFPDLLFGLAWVAACLAMVGVAVNYGTDLGNADFKNSKKRKGLKNLCKIFILSFLFALILAQIMMSIIMRFGGMMINVSLFLMEGLLFGTGLLCANISRWFFAVMFFGLFGMALLFHCMSLGLIKRAAATLHVGCTMVLTFPFLQFIAFCTALAALISFFVFIVAIVGFVEYKNSRDADTNEIIFPVLLFILIFFWTQQVFKYILIASTSATAHAWWNGRVPTVANHPALNALARSLTYNLGAIAFGALFVAIVETIVLIVNYVRKRAKKCPGGCCVDCLLGCVECCLGCCAAVLDYVNKYAFVYVGIHGYSYLYAGRQVVELFSKHGFAVVGADFFIDLVFFLNALIIGAVTAMFGILLANNGPDSWTNHVNNPETTVGLSCALAGLFIANVVFSVVDGANKATMVLFAENPHLLEITHPDDHKRLESSWTLLAKELKDDDDDAA